MNSLLFTLLLVSPVACRAVPPEPAAVVVQNAVTASSTGTGDGYTQLTIDEGKGQLLVILHDKSVTALLDGKVLPAERVTRDGDKLTIEDASGQPLYTVRVLDDTHSLIYPYDANYYVTTSNGVNWTGPGGRVTTLSNAGPRRKLIGVSTGSVDSALRAQLGLEGDAFVIESVNDDMPAAKAGAQPWDVVTAIDGDAGASTEKLRKALDDKKPGDTLVLTVLRSGKSQDLTLTVEEPRAAPGMYWPSAEGSGQAWRGFSGWDNPDSAAALKEMLAQKSALDAEREELATKLADLKDRSKALADKKGAEAQRHMAELAAEEAKLTARQAEMEAEVARRSSEMALIEQGHAGGRVLMLPQGQALGAGAAAGALTATDDRLKQLEERLARLEELLERLAARESAAPQSGEEPGHKP
ncbi:MAG TPA: PDZ domain-containing protein [Planctomycetota bacterium]|nr:PDZ domain-containing protein [Planctomycetota bacterium]